MNLNAAKKRQTALSFVTLDGDGKLNYWDVAPTGDWSKDVETGREIAAETAKYVRRNDEPMIMEKVVKSIQRVQPFGGIEIGFLHRVGEFAALAV